MLLGAVFASLFLPFLAQEHSLMKDLFKNYNKRIRPVKFYENVTTVYVAPYIYDLLEVNERQQSVAFIEWLSLLWNDDLLVWDPLEYGNITQLVLPYDQIWKPDLILFNVIDRARIFQDFDTINVLVIYDGSVIFYQPEVLSLRCKLDVSFFPWDTQNCTLRYGTWAYISEYLTVKPSDAFLADPNAFILTNTVPEWQIVSLNGMQRREKYDTYTVLGPKFWDEVHFHLIFKRKPIYHVFVMLIPSFIITTIAILGLFSPFNSEGVRQEKVTLGLTTLLTMAVMLQIVSDSVPRTSSGLPLLGSYIMAEFIISAVGTAVTVLLMYIHQRALSRGWKIPQIVLKWLVVREKPTPRVRSMSGQLLERRQSCVNKTRKEPLPEMEIILDKLEMIFSDFKWLDDYVFKRQTEVEKHALWNKAFDKIDFGLLIVFLVINAALTVFTFVPVLQW